MAYFPPTGSVVGFQSDPAAFQASVTGIVGVRGNPSISGTVQVGNFPTSQNVSGSVVAFQGTNPWTVVSSISGGIFPISGSVAAVITNTNVNVSGSVVASQGTTPWLIGSVYGNVSGSVVAFQGGTAITSLVSTVPSSVIVGTSIFGQLPGGTAVLGSVAALQGTDPWTVKSSLTGGIFPISGSVAATITNTNVNVSGSVVAFQGGAPWANTNVGSVITVFQAPSIVGTYAEDAAHTTADKGLFVLGVRNDAVASFTGANLEYGPQATDSAGRLMTKPFAAEEARIEGYGSTVNVSVTTLVAAAGAGLRNYITDIMIANTGAATTLVTFKDGAASVLGYTIAPTGGGSNMSFQTPIRTGANATFDFQATTGTSVLYATVKGFKAP